ncbi:protein kinase [bacterium]|nr:protein kinase [bacterium]MBP9808578.1 protein kinase [bacterium]
MPEDSIIGGFKIISLIGIGGMGAVYLVEHMSLRRRLALKILTAELVNEQSWQRFKAEAKILGALSHPTLVKVYDLGIHAQAIPFYSMDYLNGRSIEEILADDGPIDLETTIDIMLEVLDGLAYAHRNGIVHRDLKPGNIMYCTIDGAKAVKVLDFGISKLMDHRGTAQAMTVAGDVFGSPFYMSPEQSRGEGVDPRADIYSIGCTLFEMLTGFVPYEHKSSIEIMLMHQEADIPLLAEVSDIEFSPSVDLVLAKCLAKSPDARYQSAKELALDLVRIKEGKAVHAYAKGFAQRGAIIADKEDAAQENSTSTIVLSGLAVATLIVSCSLFYFWANQQKRISKSQAKAPVNANFDGDHVLPESEFTDLTTAKPVYFAVVSKDGMSATFKFPSNQSLGQIGCDAANNTMFEAKSLVHLSLKDGLKLQANNYLLEHPSLFEGFRPNEIACLSAPSGGEEIIKVKPAMPHICKLTGITRLDLQLSNLDDSDVTHLNKFTRLNSLSLSLTEITGNGLSNFQHLKNLHKLSFNYNNGIHELVAALAGSENLDELSIDSPDKPIEAEDLQRLARLKNLSFLSMQNSGINDKSLELLYGMPRLTTLNINECTISNAAIEKFKKSYGGRKIEVISTETQLLKSKGGLKGDPETGL